MPNQKHLFTADQLPVDLDGLGTVLSTELVIPGLYAASLKIPGRRAHTRAYLMYRDCPHLSDAAKRYGKSVPNHQGLLMFIDERTSIPSHVVDYEVLRYKLRKGIPLTDRDDPRTVAACGAELYPEYFGAYPAPYVTPWGYTTRHRAVVNGIFYLETDRCSRGLAVVYPLYRPLSDLAKALAARTEEDVPAYLFFRETDACVPLFELYNYIANEMGRKLPAAAIKNSLCQNHPEYARQYNEALQALGRPQEYYIAPDPGAGTDFFEF